MSWKMLPRSMIASDSTRQNRHGDVLNVSSGIAVRNKDSLTAVTLVVRRLRTHAGHPKSCDHIS